MESELYTTVPSLNTTSLISSEKSNYVLSFELFIRFAIANHHHHFYPPKIIMITEKKRTTSLKSRKLVKRGKPTRLSVRLSVGICECVDERRRARGNPKTEPNKLAMIYHSISATASDRLAASRGESERKANQQEERRRKKNFRNRRKLFIDGSQLYNVV